MAENEEEYELVRSALEDACDMLRARGDKAIAALDRIRQNREWEVLRARNRGAHAVVDAIREHVRGLEGEGVLLMSATRCLEIAEKAARHG